MAINATSNGSATRELIPAGVYPSRCYKMIHIGTVPQTYNGETKLVNKIRIGWELPTETRVFGDKGELPLVIDKEYTLSMHPKSKLRDILKSWRGKDFTDDEAKNFDVTRLLGVPCMLNIIHEPSKDGSRMYQQIAGVMPVPKGTTVPPQVNPRFEFNYDEFDEMKFDTLPDFIRARMIMSVEYQRLKNPAHTEINEQMHVESDLPF